MSERLDDRIRPEVTASSDRLLKRRAAPDELFASGCRSCVACSPAACKDETRRDGALIAARCANPRAALWPQRPHWPFATVRGMQQLVQNLRQSGLTWTSPIRPPSFKRLIRLRISKLAAFNGAQRVSRMRDRSAAYAGQWKRGPLAERIIGRARGNRQRAKSNSCWPEGASLTGSGSHSTSPSFRPGCLKRHTQLKTQCSAQ
jgi:hypothetical protein